MGRKSTGEYPENWEWIAEGVKDEAGWCCIRCWHEHDPVAGYGLTVHHLDLNKSNCSGGIWLPCAKDAICESKVR